MLMAQAPDRLRIGKNPKDPGDRFCHRLAHLLLPSGQARTGQSPPGQRL